MTESIATDSPILGFRAWRLHAGSLWPVRDSARCSWPLGDVRASCEAWERDISLGHAAPAPGQSCVCGLYAYHELEVLERELMDGVDVWGAVLGWGRVEVHQDGFRSEWQRPVVVSGVPWHYDARRGEIREAAAQYGAVHAAWDDLDTIAREFGDPLSLLLDRSAWLYDRCAPRVKKLTESVLAGSVCARRDLAARAIDVATHAAASRQADAASRGLLMRLEVALLTLLAVVERWSRGPLESKPVTMSEFRSAAAWWIEWALQHGGMDRRLAPPSNLTFDEVREVADALPPLPDAIRGQSRRAGTPLTRKLLLGLLRELGACVPESDFLIDGLWGWLECRFYDRRGRSAAKGVPKLTGDLFAAGSRANRIVSHILGMQKTVGEGRLREIADDRAVHPCLRARALERLAEGGRLDAIREFLAHPLADVFAADHALRKLGEHGRLEARSILARGPRTDAELCACLSVLGREGAKAARERLDRGPMPSDGQSLGSGRLLYRCMRALCARDAANIIQERIRTGEAITNGEWWPMIRQLPPRERKAVARELLARIADTPSPEDASYL